jgi:hypothetical protein
MAESKIVPVRFPEKQLLFLVRESQRRGLTISAYIRFLVEKERER